MSVGKVTFRGVEAPAPQQPQEQTKVSFKGQENPIDEEKSNATKYMIGATALAAVAVLAIAGYHGHLGEGIQKFLGGAKKAVEKEGAKATTKSTTSTTTPPTASQAVTEASEAVAQEAKNILSGEEAVKSINEYFAKFEPNSKAFVPKNDKDIVIVFRASADGIKSKNVYKLSDFKWNSSASEVDAKSLSGAVFQPGFGKNSKVNMRLDNGTYVEIQRLSDLPTPNYNGISTEIRNPEKHITYNKSVQNGLINESIVMTPPVEEANPVVYQSGVYPRFEEQKAFILHELFSKA